MSGPHAGGVQPADSAEIGLELVQGGRMMARDERKQGKEGGSSADPYMGKG